MDPETFVMFQNILLSKFEVFDVLMKKLRHHTTVIWWYIMDKEEYTVTKENNWYVPRVYERHQLFRTSCLYS